MTAPLVSYQLDGPIATLTMDDGKVNALSPAMLGELHAAFDRALADRAVVVLSGRHGVFSAGFDLTVLRGADADALAMVRAGFTLAERMLSFPTPVVVACPGHAIAMGVFLVLSADYRIGVAGPYKLVPNEVALGITMPRAAVEICRQRLSPAAFNRAVNLAEPHAPDEALEAGFLDAVVDASGLPDAAQHAATRFAALDLDAHAATKLRARHHTLEALRAAIEADDADLPRSA
jgi:enoyl-CoA hydratase